VKHVNIFTRDKEWVQEMSDEEYQYLQHSSPADFPDDMVAWVLIEEFLPLFPKERINA